MEAPAPAAAAAPAVGRVASREEVDRLESEVGAWDGVVWWLGVDRQTYMSCFTVVWWPELGGVGW